MLKKIVIMVLLVACLLQVVPASTYAQESKATVPVFIDGLKMTFTDAFPFIQDGRTLIPYSAVATALKLNVTWDGNTRTVTASDSENVIKMQIGNKTAYRNGTPIALDVPPVIYNNRTFVPLSFLGTSLNFKVDWEPTTRRVHITTPPKQMDVTAFYALGGTTASGIRYSSWTNLFGKTYPDTSMGNTDIVDELAFGWFSLDRQGALLTKHEDGWQRPDGWENVLTQADKYKIDTEMTIFMKDDKGDIAALIKNPTAVSTAVTSIVNEAKLYKGVNLDFENLGWEGNPLNASEEKKLFTSFVSKLDAKLEEANLSLTLTLHPPNSAFIGYDYKALGELADQIIVMAYNYGTVPGPEPINKVEEAIKLAIAEVPVNKLLLGVSTPNETPQSIIKLVGLAKKYDLKGIALWYLGPISDEMWASLKTTIKVR